jgi:signal transduction histidine kinase/ActR/RegA family two-component response regulator
MWGWRKKQVEDRPGRGVAWAGLQGASREELMREAIQTLSREARADRLGVWLELDYPSLANSQSPPCLRGLVWEAQGDETPKEWQRLSLEPPLPWELFSSGKSVDQVIDNSQFHSMIGPLVGLRRALWTPIAGKGRLHGVLLAGSRKHQSPAPPALAESVAAELALALELEEEQRLARERQSDVKASAQFLAALAGRCSPDKILSQLVASCTGNPGTGPGAGAVFALIGALPPGAQSSGTPKEVEFNWESGDTAWTHTVQWEPLVELWRRALEIGHVVGEEPPVSWSKEGLARVVAIPLISSGDALGVLVAGIGQHASSLSTLERLELRAAFAVSALERRKLHAEQARWAVRRRELLESSPEPTLLLDLRGNVAALNNSARELLEAVRSQRVLEIPHEQAQHQPVMDPRHYVGRPFAGLFSEGEQQHIEAWLTRAVSGGGNQTLAPVEVCKGELLNGVLVSAHAPVPVGDDVVAVVLSPAASHELARQRSRFEAELHNVLEWVEEGIVLFDADHNVRAMNTRFAQIAGISPQETEASTTLESLITLLAERAAEPEEFARRWRALARATEGGMREEIQLSRPVPRVLERSVRPVLDPAGRRLGRVEIYRDLSAHRVFQARLLQTEKLAALGQMLTGVAHELSNPLTSILGYSQRLLVRKDLAGRTAEARQIYEEAERASTILRQLLLTARETHPERKRVSLNEVISRAMELQRFSSAAEKIRIELELDPTLPFIMGDPGQLQQVLMNLIGNARQAILQEGKPGTIRVRTARINSRHVLLQVIDDGPGVSPSILARIFDPFFTTKPAGVGTGLGLSIVLSVVREHGGQVNALNSPGGGATFSIEFPVAAGSSLESVKVYPDHTEQPLLVTRTAAGATNRLRTVELPATSADHRRMRVLVVEDEPTVARLIADVLEDEGLRVDVLLDGREALDRASREQFDLVICDMKMSGIDGRHFYEALANSRNPLTERFLFVTGDTLARHTQRFLERNRLPHLAKPFRVEELTAKVAGLLNRPFTGASRAATAKEAN